METVLTHRWFSGRASALVLLVSLLSGGPKLAYGAQPPNIVEDSKAKSGGSAASGASSEQLNAVKAVKIKTRSFERILPKGGQMTWVIQNTLYEDGTRVLTPAGVQFEDAFGLTVLILDDVTPQENATPAIVSNLQPAKPEHDRPPVQPVVLEDKPELLSASFSHETPQLSLRLRSLLIDLNELKTGEPSRVNVPPCENGRRRAVAFLRAEKLASAMNLDKNEAAKWSRYGRAACVQWNTLPQLNQTKTESRTRAQSRKDETSQRN